MAQRDPLIDKTPASRAATRVLVVDDSSMMRRLLSDALSEDASIKVVGTASDGASALEKISQLLPDVVTLDVEMPGMDGLSALRKIKQLHPLVRVIMVSSLTERAAPATVKALMIGANDFLHKPDNSGPIETSREFFRQELLNKIRAVARTSPASPPPPAISQRIPVPVPVLSRASPGPPHALVIGVSTGGPQALAAILPEFPADFPLPILIVQHMPPNFTKLLADRLNSHCKITIAEATHGQRVEPGEALIAPGGYHMTVASQGNHVVTRLDQDPMENSCRPAVDVLFRSAAKVWGGRVMAAILTGMGHDGAKGAEILKQQGAWVLAQDEESSVVWGMPGTVVHARLADEVQSLERIVPTLLKRIGHTK